MADTDTLPAHERALQEAHDAREEFLSKANDIFENSRAGITSVADAFAAANPAPPEKPTAVDTKPAAAAPAASKTSTIPGPPTAAAPPASVPASEPAGPSASQQATTEPSEDISDLPAADAYDKGMSRPKSGDWKRLRSATDKYHAQLLEARKELDALKAKTTATPTQGELPKEVQEQLRVIQTERDELLQRLEAVAVERSPRFEQQFKPRLEAAINQAKHAVGPEKADRIASLLQQPESAWRDEQIEAVMQEIGSPLRTQKLMGAVAELDRINNERAALANQGSALYKQWQSEQAEITRRQQEERERAVNAEFDAELSEWKGTPYVDDNGIALAREVYSGKGKSWRDVARAAMWVAAGPKAVATAIALSKENAELKAQVAKLSAAQPGNSNDAGTKMKADDDLPQNIGYVDGIIQAGIKAGLPWK